jgi:hypothetical protein
MQAQEVAGISKDPKDVVRPVAEGVARVSPLPARVDESTAVGMDAEEELGMTGDQLLLPLGELDPSMMLATRTVLRKQARPGLGVGRHLDEGEIRAPGDVAPPLQPMHSSARVDYPNRRFARVDDARIPEIEIHSEPVNRARMLSDAAVAQVQAE